MQLTGSVTYRTAPAIAELLRIPGLGPKRVKALYHDLDVQTMEQLYCAARDDRIRTLPCFGEKIESNILRALEAHANQTQRFKLTIAAQYAEALKKFLAAIPGVLKGTVAGSCRRMAQKSGLEVNECGVFRNKPRIAGGTEASVYAAVGLSYITPELRENRGEIVTARAGKLPQLMEQTDLRGDLHVHTKAPGGYNSLREMAPANLSNGFEYIAITEHSRRLAFTHVLDPLQLAQR